MSKNKRLQRLAELESAKTVIEAVEELVYFWHPIIGKVGRNPKHAANLRIIEAQCPSGWEEYTGQDTVNYQNQLNASDGPTNSGNPKGEADQEQGDHT